MGITRGASKLLAITLRDKVLSGSVITLGVLGIQNTYDELVKTFSATNFNYTALRPDEIIADNLTQWKDTVHQSVFFKMLGFNNIDSIDYFPDENPTFVYDLNKPLPPELYGKYDLVYDGGTTEHCFDVKQVLTNAVNLAKVGGMIIHHLPMNKSIDHGFYQFSPTWFFDFYGTNGFTDMEMKIHFQNSAKELYFTYDPRKDRALPFSFGYDAVYAFFSARKKSDQPVINPIQSTYRKAFGDLKPVTTGKEIKKSPWKRLKYQVLKAIFAENHVAIKKKIDYWVDKRRLRRRVARIKRNAIPL